MHPDSKTPVLALVARQNNPLGGDCIRLILFGYFPNGGGVNYFSPHDIHLSLGTSGPATDENQHPDLETAMRESLATHRLWDRWAKEGRGLMVGLKCWRESTLNPISPIVVELVGHEGTVMRVVYDQFTANYHPTLYMALREFILEERRW